MRIAVFDYSGSPGFAAKLALAVDAVNKQLREHFFAEWGFSATLMLQPGVHHGQPPQPGMELGLGDGVIYVCDKVKEEAARFVDGLHDAAFDAIPYGVVLLRSCHWPQQDEGWQAAFSHEVLELVGNPQINLLVAGPHPLDRRRHVMHWFEMCDAVQNFGYKIDGIRVSDFVLPSYFTLGEEQYHYTHQLGKMLGLQDLESFDLLPGCYINYYDAERQRNCIYSAPNDELAADVLQKKADAMVGRGARVRARERSAQPA
jgi:hypothetical protein